MVTESLNEYRTKISNEGACSAQRIRKYVYVIEYYSFF